MAIVEIKILKIGKTHQREFMSIRGGSLCEIDFPALVGLIIHDSFGPILFDTGYDSEFFAATKQFPEKFYALITPMDLQEGESLPDQLAQFGIKPDEIKGVILSHFHGDHIAGLKNYPNAKIFCAKEGLTAIRSGTRIQLSKHGYLPKLLPENIAQRSEFFEEMPQIDLGSEFAPFEFGHDILGDASLIAIELKGHCKGHYGLIARRSGEKPYFFIGDAAWSLKAVEENRPPPTITLKLLGEKQDYEQTLGRLSQLQNGAKSRVEIIPSHCAKTAEKLVAK